MMVEGMKTKDSEAENEKSEDAEIEEAEEQEETTNKPTKPTPTVEGSEGQKTANKPAGEAAKAAEASKVTEHNPKEVPKEAKKQGLSTLTPANYNGKGGDDSKSGNRIDYASTLEQAYDNIESIIDVIIS